MHVDFTSCHIEEYACAHLLWVEILQVVQGEDRLKAFPEGLKLPGHALVQGPVHHQLHREGKEVQS